MNDEKPKFKTGEEFVSRINGEKGYIILPFRAGIVKIKKALKVIPVSELIFNEKIVGDAPKRNFFIKNDEVRIISCPLKGIIGTIIDIKWFYVVHLYRGGIIKVILGEILLKPGSKIIPFIPLTQLKPAPGQQFGRRIIRG